MDLSQLSISELQRLVQEANAEMERQERAAQQEKERIARAEREAEEEAELLARKFKQLYAKKKREIYLKRGLQPPKKQDVQPPPKKKDVSPPKKKDVPPPIPPRPKKGIFDALKKQEDLYKAQRRPELKEHKEVKEHKGKREIKVQDLRLPEPETQFFHSSAEVKIFHPKPSESADPRVFFEENQDRFVTYLAEMTRKYKNFKVQFKLEANVRKVHPNSEGEIEIKEDTAWFSSSKTQTAPLVSNRTQNWDALMNAFATIYNLIDIYNENGSDWRFQSVRSFHINIIRVIPFHNRGSSYIPTPSELASKKAIVNVQNEDQQCFKWALLSALHYDEIKKNHNRPSSYKKWENDLDFSGISFPVSVKSIPTFEEKNNLTINVYHMDPDDKKIYSLHISKRFHLPDSRLIDLILIHEENEEVNSHYAWIRDLSKLVGKHNYHKKFICRACLNCFGTQDLLDQHLDLKCYEFTTAKAVLPPKGKNFEKFHHIHKQLPAPFVVYADFEAFTCPEANKMAGSYQTHKPASAAYKVVSIYPQFDFPVKMFRDTPDKSVVAQFLESLEKDCTHLLEIVHDNKPLIMTPAQEQKFRSQTHCHICSELITDPKVKVRDHDHISGDFRGAAHNDCNLQYKYKKNYRIPVMFHNLKNYDSHFIIPELAKLGGIGVIPNTMDKYISFWSDKMEFKDSFQFMASSLDSLSKSLTREDFKNINVEFSHCTQEQRDILIQKGIFPYDWFNSPEKFSHTQLPPKGAFYSKLNEEEVTDEDYARAHRVWNLFEMKEFSEYHDLYLKTDVCILADIFENFRKTCLKAYGLDPTHYFTAPGLFWDAMLRFTKVKIECFHGETIDQKTGETIAPSQYDMFMFVEKGMRGGISQISKRFAKANNPLLLDHDPSQPTSYITYLDANNLYGWAMSQALPLGEYKWVNPDNFDEKTISTILPDSDQGCILEVDLEYPQHLHDLHNDYPLAPELTLGQASPFISEIMSNSNVKEVPTKKLIPNLNNKSNYVVHYRNLQLYLSLGLKLTKVHKVLQFKQSPWLSEYIQHNTNMRTKSNTNFEKDFYKLANNSVFGKTMENVRNHIDVRLLTTDEQAMKLSRKPIVRNWRIMSEDLLAMEMAKYQIKFNKPIIVGMSILDLSKTIMYDFHYNTIKKMYGDKAELLFTDTDSLSYQITTPDLYADLKTIQDQLDTSDYPKDHPLFSNDNKKVIGKFKDEANGFPISEFCGLRPKMYSFLFPTGKDKKTAKGIKRTFIKKELRHENYRQAIVGKDYRQQAKFNQIRSRDHAISSVVVNKVGLCCFDDKRYVLDDNILTLAHGNHRIKSE